MVLCRPLPRLQYVERLVSVVEFHFEIVPIAANFQTAAVSPQIYSSHSYLSRDRAPKVLGA
jgi:hypothetical protein